MDIFAFWKYTCRTNSYSAEPLVRIRDFAYADISSASVADDKRVRKIMDNVRWLVITDETCQAICSEFVAVPKFIDAPARSFTFVAPDGDIVLHEDHLIVISHVGLKVLSLLELFSANPRMSAKKFYLHNEEDGLYCFPEGCEFDLNGPYVNDGRYLVAENRVLDLETMRVTKLTDDPKYARSNSSVWYICFFPVTHDSLY